MMEHTYTIGLDYGSLSGRGVLVDTRDGTIMAEAVFSYPHGIMDSELPDGTPLKGMWCLQDPSDYLDVLEYVVPKLLRQSGIPARCVVGIGVDFTASTVIPVDGALTPLSDSPAYASRPHAWAKLWKHHGAVKQAEALTRLCRETGIVDLGRYGGQISPESRIPKILQVFEEDREIYDQTACFMEAADYITSLLVGEPVFGAGLAAAKALWSKEQGYPDSSFWEKLDPELKGLTKKLTGPWGKARLRYPGERIGSLERNMAERLGLPAGIAVSAPQMDSYAAVPGSGIADPGGLMMIIGTSTGILLVGKDFRQVEGVTAALPDTLYPGLWGYASGQASVGDGFQWFLDHSLPGAYEREAAARGKGLHQYLTELAAPLTPGQTGLLALDWMNGNKSCLGNNRLSGMILGVTLKTRPEHIYRALLEATAFGARKILEAYEAGGIAVDRIIACGGIAGKNPLLMQIYADVFGREISVCSCPQAAALGAAIYGAAAAGEAATGEAAGLSSVAEAVRQMTHHHYETYLPVQENHEQYEKIYQEYSILHDYFGRGGNSVMEYLSQVRAL